MRSLKTAHLFRIIQSFLSGKDYLALMNCNKEIFSAIKRETMKYFLKTKDTEDGSLLKILELFPSLMEKVDSPMKQLSLKLVISSIASTNTFRSMMSYLHSITISTTYRATLIDDYSGVDFTLFNNIPMVSLRGFPGVQRITNGLENVHHLTLNIPDLMEIYEFPSSHCLQELHLLNCRDEVYHNLPVKTNFDDKLQLLYILELRNVF